MIIFSEKRLVSHTSLRRFSKAPWSEGLQSQSSLCCCWWALQKGLTGKFQDERSLMAAEGVGVLADPGQCCKPPRAKGGRHFHSWSSPAVGKPRFCFRCSGPGTTLQPQNVSVGVK